MVKFYFVVEFFEVVLFWAVINKQQFGRYFFVDFSEYFEYIFYVFYFLEVGYMYQNLFFVWCNCFFKVVFVDFLEVFKVNEVIDYFDIVMDIEVFIGLLFEVFRYCSDII